MVVAIWGTSGWEIGHTASRARITVTRSQIHHDRPIEFVAQSGRWELLPECSYQLRLFGGKGPLARDPKLHLVQH